MEEIEEGKIDKQGIKWFTEGYLNSKIIIAKDESRQQTAKEIFDEGEKMAKEKPIVSPIYSSHNAMEKFKEQQKIELKFLQQLKKKFLGTEKEDASIHRVQLPNPQTAVV